MSPQPRTAQGNGNGNGVWKTATVTLASVIVTMLLAAGWVRPSDSHIQGVADRAIEPMRVKVDSQEKRIDLLNAKIDRLIDQNAQILASVEGLKSRP